ncbi:MAG: polymer-forming cytoskeletal protein [Anaerolineales bacterium]|nr:polymer-forming cytoskeletal protein [Anaerolineales bacterium]
MLKLQKICLLSALLILMFIGSLCLPSRALAVETDPDGQVEKGQVIDDDLFLSGERVVVDGVVKGDFYATANTIIINGVVHGSAFLAAQTIKVNGTVKGSLYGASQSIELGEEAQIERNLFYAGFALQTMPGSQIGKDALFTGYQAVLDGTIQRDVRASVGALEISGEIGRNVEVTVGDPEEGQTRPMPFYTAPGAPAMIPSGLRIKETAKIGGTLRYSSVKEQSQGIQSKPQGEVIFTPIETKDRQTKRGIERESLPYVAGKYVLNRVQEIVTLFLIGLLGVWLLPQHLQGWKDRIKSEPLASGLNGLLTIVVGYVGAGLIALVLLAVGIFIGVLTLGGLSRAVLGIGFSSLGLALAVFTLVVTYVSKILVSLWVGEWTVRRIAPQAANKILLSLLVGILIYVFVRSIPILGWVVGLVATLVGVGAIYLVLRERILPPQKPVSNSGVVASGV